MEDKRQQLYDLLLSTGKVSENEIGTLDEFRSVIKDENTTRQLYNHLMKSGLFSTNEIGSSDDFYASISSDFIKKKEEEEPGFFGDLWKSFEAGIVSMGAGLMEAAKPLAGYTMTGRGPAERMLKRNEEGELVPFTDEDIQKSQAEAQRTAMRWAEKSADILKTTEQFDVGIWDNIKRGEWGSAGKQIAMGISQTTAQMIPTMLNAPSGIITTTLSSKGQKELEMVKEMQLGKQKYTPEQIAVTSAGFGLTEGLFDLATAGMFKTAKNVFRMALDKGGEPAAKEVADSFIKQFYKGVGMEVPSEVGTQFSQNVIDNIAAGKDVPLSSGLMDAGILALTFTGATHSKSYMAGKLLGAVAKRADRIKVSQNKAKIEQIEQQKQDGNITPEQAEILTNIQQGLTQDNADLITKTEAIARRMSPEQRKDLMDMSNRIDEIDSVVADPNITEDVKNTLLDERMELINDRESLLTSIDEEIQEVIQEDEEVVAETQRQLEYLQEQGIDITDMTIGEIEEKYKQLQEAPAEEVPAEPTPAKPEPTPIPEEKPKPKPKPKKKPKPKEPTVEKQISELEKERDAAIQQAEADFKDPEIAMTKAELRKKKKEITQKFEQDAKEIRKEIEEPVQEERVLEEEMRPVRVRDDEKDRVEAEPRKKEISIKEAKARFKAGVKEEPAFLKITVDKKKPKEDKITKLFDKAIQATDVKGKAFDATLGIPLSAVNLSLKAVKEAYMAGKTLAECIKDGYNHLVAKGHKINEKDYSKYVIDQLKTQQKAVEKVLGKVTPKKFTAEELNTRVKEVTKQVKSCYHRKSN